MTYAEIPASGQGGSSDVEMKAGPMAVEERSALPVCGTMHRARHTLEPEEDP